MEKKSSVDPGILAPVSFGVLSILGIIVIFLLWRAEALRPAGELVSTETPFRYVYLGTEPGLSTLTPRPTETPMPAPTEPSDLARTPDPNGQPFLTFALDEPGASDTAGGENVNPGRQRNDTGSPQ